MRKLLVVAVAAAGLVAPAGTSHAGPCPSDVVMFFGVGGVEQTVEGTRVSAHFPNAAAVCDDVQGTGANPEPLYTVPPGATHAKTRLTSGSGASLAWSIHGPLVGQVEGRPGAAPVQGTQGQSTTALGTVYESPFVAMVPTATGDIYSSWNRNGASGPGWAKDMTYRSVTANI